MSWTRVRSRRNHSKFLSADATIGVMDGEAVLDAVGGDECKVNDVFEQLVIV